MTVDWGFYSIAVETKRAEFEREAARVRRADAAAATRPGGRSGLRRGLLGLAVAGLFSLGAVTAAAAQETAAAGNGGTALAGANGGAVLVGDLNAGDNAGNAIAVGDVAAGAIGIDGGSTATGTSLGVGAAGGVGLADASGGDLNLAVATN